MPSVRLSVSRCFSLPVCLYSYWAALIMRLRLIAPAIDWSSDPFDAVSIEFLRCHYTADKYCRYVSYVTAVWSGRSTKTPTFNHSCYQLLHQWAEQTWHVRYWRKTYGFEKLKIMVWFEKGSRVVYLLLLLLLYILMVKYSNSRPN